MRTSFLFLILVLANFSHADALVDWSSEEGVKRLERSRAKADFFKLANHFETQKNKLFCGPTSGVIVLNALRIGKDSAPEDTTTFDSSKKEYLPKDFSPYFHKYTQTTFFNDETAKVKSIDTVCGKPVNGASDFGFQLRQYEGALKAHGLNATLRVVDEKADLKDIRKEISENLKNPSDFVLVNYARKSLGQNGGGHISPVGAYDAKSDSFLVLDVNPNTAPWVWVTAKDLVEAMRTKDTVENRGYLIVSEGKLTPKP